MDSYIKDRQEFGNRYNSLDAEPTSYLGSCPECGAKESKIVWGWDGSYYDMICSNGHDWTYTFKTASDVYRGAVKCAKEKSQNDPHAFSGGFDIMKKWQETQTGHKRPEDYYTSGFGIVRQWQRQHGPRPVHEDKPFSGGFDIMKKFQRGKQPKIRKV